MKTQHPNVLQNHKEIMNALTEDFLGFLEYKDGHHIDFISLSLGDKPNWMTGE